VLGLVYTHTLLRFIYPSDGAPYLIHWLVVIVNGLAWDVLDPLTGCHQVLVDILVIMGVTVRSSFSGRLTRASSSLSPPLISPGSWLVPGPARMGALAGRPLVGFHHRNSPALGDGDQRQSARLETINNISRKIASTIEVDSDLPVDARGALNADTYFYGPGKESLRLICSDDRSFLAQSSP
jgi:hypothetical protein